nr:MAG TPA: hypothetical protein [Caudoviricetes sp.]
MIYKKFPRERSVFPPTERDIKDICVNLPFSYNLST